MKELILFDLIATQPNSEGDFHGGGKYAKIIFLSIINNNLFNNKLFYCFYDDKFPLDDEINTIILNKNIANFNVNNISVSQIVKDYKIRKVYSALPGKQLISIINFGDCDIITTIHGLRFLETKLTFNSLSYANNFKSKLKMIIQIIFSDLMNKKFSNYYMLLLKKSTVITVSNHSKFSILSYFGKFISNSNNIKVFYSPDVTSLNSFDDFNNKFEYSDYFLIVSGNRWVKNNLRSLLALDEYFSEVKTNKIVLITGVKNPKIFLKRLRNKDKFIFMPYVDEEYLNNLYKNAFCLIYMSLNEGFGYPPLEAMKFGVPVITCPFTSITEICGNAVLYANPYSIKEIKNRILWLSDNNECYFHSLGYSRYLKIKKRQDEDLVSLVNFILN